MLIDAINNHVVTYDEKNKIYVFGIEEKIKKINKNRWKIKVFVEEK